MTERSSIKLERDFFRAFFAALVLQGLSRVNWRSPDTNARFRRAYGVLSRRKGEDADLDRLLYRLRPDPISGSSPALHANLVHMQPGNVSAKNPGYQDVTISETPETAEALLSSLPELLRTVISEAAREFVGAKARRDVRPPETISDPAASS